MIWKKNVNVCVICGFVSSEDRWVNEHCPECKNGFLQITQVTVMVGEGSQESFDEDLDEKGGCECKLSTTFVPPVNI